MQKLEKECKYECGFTVIWKGRTGQPGSTGFFEKNSTVEHTFNRCKEIKEKGLVQQGATAPLPKDQTTLQQQQPQQTQQYVTVEKRVESGDSPTGINLNSVYIIASDARKEIRELKKDIKTLMDVLDGIAQNQTLLIERVGYPKPEPAATTATTVKLSEEELNDMMESDAQAMDDMERERKEMEDKKKQQNIKIRPHLDQMTVLQNEPTEKEKVGTSMPCSNCKEKFEPDELWANTMGKVFCNVCFQLFKDKKEEPIQRVVDGNGWAVISERFICHKCQGLKHNGYEKIGTKVCDDCKMELEAKEALAELEDDNEEDENLRLRTRGDILNGEDDLLHDD